MHENIEISQRWWSCGEIADCLNLSQPTVSAWCRAGLLSACRFGRAWRIADADLKSFLAKVHTSANRVRAGGDSDFGERLRQAAAPAAVPVEVPS